MIMGRTTDGEQVAIPSPSPLSKLEQRVVAAALEITKGSSNIVEISAALHVAAVAISALREEAGQNG